MITPFAIDIVVQSAPNIGPMSIVSSTITDIGPVAPGLTVEFDVYPEASEILALSCIKSVQQQRTVTATLASRTSGSFHYPVALPVEGAPVRMVVTYKDSLGVIVQQGTVPGLTWSNAGLWAEILDQPVASGGFTPTDRDLMQQIWNAVYKSFTVS